MSWLSDLEGAIHLEELMNPDKEIDLWRRAIFSATEIEVYMREGKRFGHSHVRKLAQELESFSREKPDILRADIYSRLLWPNWDDLEGKTTTDAYLQINLFAKDLRYFEELSRERQEKLRETCDKLSKLAHSNLYRLRLAA